MTHKKSHAASFAEAFYIGNLLFVGVFYIALWGLYFLSYKGSTDIEKMHIKQALIASSISTVIFLGINLMIILTNGYASVMALFSLEFYFMLVVPLFLVVGILAFIKAIKEEVYLYPLIGRFVEKYTG